jgi:hypothetical protein
MIEATPLIITLSIILTLVSVAERVLRNRKKFKNLESFILKNKRAIEASLKEGKITKELYIENQDLQNLPELLEEIDELETLIELDDLIDFKFPNA